MSLIHHDRVGKALELLRDGLRPFIERELSAKLGKYWITKATEGWPVTEGWQHDLAWPEGEDAPNLDAALEAQLGAQAETARELCYRLYTLCERKKRNAEALSYNALVQSWPEITRLAREKARPVETQARLF